MFNIFFQLPSPIRPHSIPGSTSKGHDESHFDEHLDNIYDSDFSQVSSSSNHSAALASLPLRDLLPPEMTSPPTLPVDMLWHCPVAGGTCSYVIDLCSPSDNNLRLVHKCVPPKDSINYLLNKDWKHNDERVMTVFYEIVHAHWEEHLRELDIKYVRHDDVVSHRFDQTLTGLSGFEQGTFEWIHPQRRQRPWPTKWRRRRPRIQQSDLKARQESPEV
jgi:hypothetical protein